MCGTFACTDQHKLKPWVLVKRKSVLEWNVKLETWNLKLECCRFGSQKQQDMDLYIFAAS